MKFVKLLFWGIGLGVGVQIFYPDCARILLIVLICCLVTLSLWSDIKKIGLLALAIVLIGVMFRSYIYSAFMTVEKFTIANEHSVSKK